LTNYKKKIIIKKGKKIKAIGKTEPYHLCDG